MQSVKHATAIKQTSMASACADKLSRRRRRSDHQKSAAALTNSQRPDHAGQRSRPTCTFIVGHNHIIIISLFG